MTFPGMLHGAVRLSDHPRALVKRIDFSKAKEIPGVVSIVTAADTPGQRHQGLIYDDWPMFVAEGEETRYVGDVMAAVAAIDQANGPNGRSGNRDRLRGSRAGYKS